MVGWLKLRSFASGLVVKSGVFELQGLPRPRTTTSWQRRSRQHGCPQSGVTLCPPLTPWGGAPAELCLVLTAVARYGAYTQLLERAGKHFLCY